MKKQNPTRSGGSLPGCRKTRTQITAEVTADRHFERINGLVCTVY